VARDCFNVLASKRVYNVNQRLLYGGGWNSNPSDEADKREQAEDIAHEITPEEFKESLTNKLLTLASINKGSNYVPLGQFPNALPRTYYLVDKGNSQGKGV
jgi:hypothetical protein